ncbi:hypothetical protein F5877DRAFT_91440 [Lentinula edodes]|nr:hypothetical protein F5877DRAFT_91440 [Lentinula edodes]
MIFAGDFAQLPPIGGEPVSLYSVRPEYDAKSLNGHCAAIGKALWHQVTYVVILRKNMRNTGLSEADIKYRKALENMRYKSCTADDIRFLNTLVSSKAEGRPFIGSKPWRDAPIIVGQNNEKDEINRMGCIRFATETKQKLCNFYSDDIISSKSETTRGKNAFKNTKASSINKISMELQKILWDIPTSCVLSLCLGLPLIIRHNAAVELSITKGQRATVYGWHSSKGVFGQPVLEVLFALLTDPPTPIEVPGLPQNVCRGYIRLPDDTKIYVTPHASQGQNHTKNTADLNTLNSHHAFYTALSRSTSGFDSKYITGGASGPLRKEFRELELLDEITRLRFEGKLDSSVMGSTRGTLIETFLDWKGKAYAWLESLTIWSGHKWLHILTENFHLYKGGVMTMEEIRDKFRLLLEQEQPNTLQWAFSFEHVLDIQINPIIHKICSNTPSTYILKGSLMNLAVYFYMMA